MKRVFFGAFIALTMFACGSAEETETEVEETVNKEAVLEMETTTDKLEQGVAELENEMEALNADIDSLLKDI
jgi:uncharacterized protein YlxW (UPF0749 family)